MFYRNEKVNVTTSPKNQFRHGESLSFEAAIKDRMEKMRETCRNSEFLTLCTYKFDLISCVYRCHAPTCDLILLFLSPITLTLFHSIGFVQEYLPAFYNADSQVYLELLNFLTTDQSISNLLNIDHLTLSQVRHYSAKL